MDMVSGIGAYSTERAQANTSLRMSVATTKVQNDQAKANGEAAVKLIESACPDGSCAKHTGVGGRLDVVA